MLTEFERGVLIGVLIGEGHFGGDGKQAHVTLRMHVRHKKLFDWLFQKVENSKLYGPYGHGGRLYYQWMVRGEALKNILLPYLKEITNGEIDEYTRDRLLLMVEKYNLNREQK